MTLVDPFLKVLNNILHHRNTKMPGTVRVLLENLKREQETEKKRLADKQLKAEQDAEWKIQHPSLFKRLYAAWKQFKEAA
jgi:formate dehydrogenase maturation protein FdhE